MKPIKKEKYPRDQILIEQSYHDEENELSFDSFYETNYDNMFYEYCEPDIYPSFNYVYIPDMDIFSTKTERVRQNGFGCETFDIYVDENDKIHLNVYTYCDKTRIEAFLGCVIKVIMFSKNHSEKIKRIFTYMCDKYPDIYFKMMGRFKQEDLWYNHS